MFNILCEVGGIREIPPLLLARSQKYRYDRQKIHVEGVEQTDRQTGHPIDDILPNATTGCQTA
jgi:hypothetical protein